MPTDRTTHRWTLTQWLALQFFPTLRQWPASQWREQLDKASGTDLDGHELVGILSAIAMMAWLLEPQAEVSASPILVYGEQFLLASLGLVLLAGPFLIRRTRRGLEQLSTPKR
ncbi:MAG TPA: hypothetical protein PKH05_06945 [Nitrospira sp.]|jgi:hypothetical protein|nr:hypothetical protein [Rhodocyclaceae bacterium]HNK15751.1 hypothetical protein [Nitrospira sp.]HNE43882.1 hypothetical protein [Rhodocyclaceae bacterium]HNL20426.1 hypothetical protein [Rhodocyclaceae bacterium]HNL88785.1 hypothetical protein [Nitrospira sp.]